MTGVVVSGVVNRAHEVTAAISKARRCCARRDDGLDQRLLHTG
jgi:hypothetical protein